MLGTETVHYQRIMKRWKDTISAKSSFQQKSREQSRVLEHLTANQRDEVN